MPSKSSAKVYLDGSSETAIFRGKSKLLLVCLFLLLIPVLFFLLKFETPFVKIDENLEFQSIDGKKQRWGDFRGSPLLVSFWATSCVICIHEIEDWKEFYASQSKTTSFELLAISMYHDRPDAVLAVTRRFTINYPVYLDLHRQIAQAFGEVFTTPTLFLIDSKGNIVNRYQGSVDFEQLAEELQQLN